MTASSSTSSLHTLLGESEQLPHDIDDSAVSVGSRMVEARIASGRTQADVANHLGVKTSTLDKWERGSASPRSNRLAALAGILGVSVTWLIVGHGDEPTAVNDLDEVKANLSRVLTQLADTLADVELLVAQVDRLGAED